MLTARILTFAGSIRTGSHNHRLAALAAKEAVQREAEVTRISLADYPLPLYDADLEAKAGVPADAVKLKQMIGAHAGVFIATAESNASITPLLKNAIDWVSRVREPGEPPMAAFQNRVFALAAATPDRFGGLRGMMATRQALELGCGALVLPDQVAVAQADQAFDDMDQLRDARTAQHLQRLIERLIDAARSLA